MQIVYYYYKLIRIDFARLESNAIELLIIIIFNYIIFINICYTYKR